MEFESCGIQKEWVNNYKLKEPIIDSISPIEAYPGQRTTIYGKNLHSNFSKFWIENNEIEIEDGNFIDRLSFTVPSGLPSGKLNVKLDVLGQILEEQELYQSTTPTVTSLDKYETGFMDTLAIKGTYFTQPNTDIEVSIGDVPQTILESGPDEIKFVINRYFDAVTPKLKLTIGNFEHTETLNMLPPQIVELDKDQYHILNEEILLKTKYFIPRVENLLLGGLEIEYANRPSTVEESGIIRVKTSDWLARNYIDFFLDENGNIPIEISSPYGSAKTAYKIFPPEIYGFDQQRYYHNQQIRVEGLDFGHPGFSQIFIDDIAVEQAEIYNSTANIIVPKDLLAGNHNLKIVTGQQESNEVSFEIESVTANGLNKTSGTRKDVFSISGSNLGEQGTYSILANGVECDLVSRSESLVEFRFPFEFLLEPEQEIVFQYGFLETPMGIINAVEPYEIYEGHEFPYNMYDFRSTYNNHFEYDGRLFLINQKGIYEYHLEQNNWSIFEAEMPNLPFSISRVQPSVAGDKMYVYMDNGFQVYDMLAKTWEFISFDLGPDVFAGRGVVLDTQGYLLTSNQMYIVDLETKEVLNIMNTPFEIRSGSDEVFQLNGRIYFDSINTSIYTFNNSTQQWQSIGSPTGDYKFSYQVTLYEYNNILYYSGGDYGALSNYMFAYDFSTQTWSEKTPMPIRVSNHVMIQRDGYLYFGLGGSPPLTFDSEEIYRYNINEDIH